MQIYPLKNNTGTYRHMSVIEQTMIFIGEPKHGIWRIQDNGMIREYRKSAKPGLEIGVNANGNLTKQQLTVIRNNYAHFIPEEGSGGYKREQDKTKSGYQDWIDLTIYHPKYNGKYDDHVPIDLCKFFCTLSQGDHPHLKSVWEYAVAQPQANKIGEFGKRAGKVIKLYMVRCWSDSAQCYCLMLQGICS